MYKHLLQQPLLFGNEFSLTYTSPQSLVDEVQSHFTTLKLANEKECLYKFSEVVVNDIRVTSELLSHMSVGAIVNTHSLLIALEGHYEIKSEFKTHQAYKEHGLIIPPANEIPLSSSKEELTHGLLINFDAYRLSRTIEIMRGQEFSDLGLQAISLKVDQVDFIHLILSLVSQINGVAGNTHLLKLNGFDDQCYRLLAMMLQPDYFLNAKPTEQEKKIVNKDFLEMLEEYVDANIAKPINITDLQDSFGLSARGLQYATNKYFGCSPRQYIYNKKLDLAYALLTDINNNENILQISSKLGFSSQSRFSKFFLQRFGIRPSEVNKKRIIG